VGVVLSQPDGLTNAANCRTKEKESGIIQDVTKVGHRRYKQETV
jgi:hypothetical protein